MVRLQKYLAECGVASRRKAETLIEAGAVLVNGVPAHVGMSVDPDSDEVLLHGNRVGRTESKLYLMLNKPAGVVTSAKDDFGRRTVLHLVRDVPERVFPVGRLDLDVEGALLLTNDGELTHRLTHPSFEIEKVYRAWVRGALSDAAAGALRTGVDLEDGRTAPAKLRVLECGPNRTRIELTLHEGKKREVKRMCAAVGHPILSLERITFAGIGVQGLSAGQWRYLTPHETAALRGLAGLR